MAEIVTNVEESVPSEGVNGFLAAELRHRIKNLFAVVAALARCSLNGDGSLEEARKAFISRLEALARADQRMFDAAWNGASLTDLVRSELEPFGDRVKATGSDVHLNSREAHCFALALHELATNASKYGALSGAGGIVSIDWHTGTRDGLLKFRWQERGGPPVSPPKRTGFGTSLLKAALGEGRMEYKIDGLTYEAEVPVQMIVTRASAAVDRDMTLQKELHVPTLLPPADAQG